jgi:hypothetical protein
MAMLHIEVQESGPRFPWDGETSARERRVPLT